MRAVERPQSHGHSERNPKKLGERDRKFWELFSQFLALTAKHRGQIFAALALLTIGIVPSPDSPFGDKTCD